MIIGNILGGLGNQMFQYAAARSLATAKGKPLYLDLSDFPGYHLHYGFELSKVFCGTFEAADEGQLWQVLGWRAHHALRNMLKRRQLALFRNKRFVVEPHFHYWPGFFEAPDDCYLAGYWQSEKYFKPIEEIIRKEFTFNSALSGQNEELAEQIAGCNAVSLHIRRGDYVSDARTRATNGFVSLAYYQNAVRRIAKGVSAPVFFVFSDDMEWVRGNLNIPFQCQFIRHNQGTESYKDMQLMSLCQHHIIANSSFSWWGAWLNPRHGKIVIYPKEWFVNTHINTEDLTPRDWIGIAGERGMGE